MIGPALFPITATTNPLRALFMAGLFGFLIFTQMPAGAATVCPVAVFRDQTLQTHPASGPEKVWTDLADLEGRDEYPVWPPPAHSWIANRHFAGPP